MGKKAIIALEDGRTFEGEAFAGEGEVFGELVFNTSMTGYQEILTDPSYHQQIVTLTYPLIGNYGINPEDMESTQIRPAALIIGEYSRIPSNWRCRMTLKDFLESQGKIGVHQVDTRAITLHIRSLGAMKCVVSTGDGDPQRLVEKARAWPGFVGRDIASEVSTPTRYRWPGPHGAYQKFSLIAAEGMRAYDNVFRRPPDPLRFRVAVLDCGLKVNQLRLLERLGCELEVFPMRTPAEEILETKPDGFFISNGPGDPAGVMPIISNLRKIAQSGLPTFGICFGHQLLGLAFGGRTYKLKFGHRGANQPVLDHTTGRVEITSQNHGFAVDIASLPPEVETTHINLNDQTSEGLRHRELPVFSVQYHPEAAPGPHDATYLFERFVKMMEEQRPQSGARAGGAA
jgi:carbamoyl-phosphate synthase small subunit